MLKFRRTSWFLDGEAASVIEFYLLPHPRIERKGARPPDADPAEIRMQRVQQVVALRRHDRRGHFERSHAAAPQPGRAVAHARLLRGLVAPAGRGAPAVLYLHRVRDLDPKRDEGDVQPVFAQMDEGLHRRQRQRRRRVDDRIARPVPTPAGDARSLATEGRMRVARLDDAMGDGQGQLYTPCSIRKSSFST